MFCPTCGSNNTDDSKFCFACGCSLEALVGFSKRQAVAAPIPSGAIGNAEVTASPATHSGSPQGSAITAPVPITSQKSMWKLVLGWFLVAGGIFLTGPMAGKTSVWDLSNTEIVVGLGVMFIADGSSWSDVSRKPKWWPTIGGWLCLCFTLETGMHTPLTLPLGIGTIVLLFFGLRPLWAVKERS